MKPIRTILRDIARSNSHPRILLSSLILFLGFSVISRPQGDVELFLERAELRLSDKDFSRALVEFRRAAHLDPDSHSALDGIARVLEATGETDLSLTVRERIIKLAHEKRWSMMEKRLALANYAKACQRLGAHGRAFSALETLHEGEAGTLRTDLQLALEVYQQGDFERASNLNQYLLERYGNIEAVWRYNSLLRSRESTGGRRIVLETLIGLRYPAPDFERLKEELQAVDSHGASSDVERIVLGEAALRAGRIQEAQGFLESVQDEALFGLREKGLALLALMRGEIMNASRHLDRASHDPTIPTELVEFIRGKSLLAEGDLEAARRALVSAIKANPLSVRSELLLGDLEQQDGRSQSAAEAYERVLEVRPNHGQALCELGSLYVKMNRVESGRQLLRRCVRTNPRGTHARDARALLKRLSG